MKLSEIRPCDNCGGKIAPMFYLVRISQAMFKPGAVKSTLGLAQMLGGSLALAEVMGPEPEAVALFSDKEPSLETTMFLCTDCYCSNVFLAEVAERLHERKEKESESKE